MQVRNASRAIVMDYFAPHDLPELLKPILADDIPSEPLQILR